jgi:hypothetical protein
VASIGTGGRTKGTAKDPSPSRSQTRRQWRYSVCVSGRAPAGGEAAMVCGSTAETPRLESHALISSQGRCQRARAGGAAPARAQTSRPPEVGKTARAGCARRREPGRAGATHLGAFRTRSGRIDPGSPGVRPRRVS